MHPLNHRRIVTAICAACIGGGAVLFAADPPKPDQPKTPTTRPATTRSAKPVNKVCPVERGHEIDPKIIHTYQGKTIGFCCIDCVDEFKKDPEKYIRRLE